MKNNKFNDRKNSERSHIDYLNEMSLHTLPVYSPLWLKTFFKKFRMTWEKLGASLEEITLVYQRKEMETINVEPIVNSDGLLDLAQELPQETSDREQLKLEIETTLAILKITLESIPDGIIVFEPSGKIVNVNQKFLQMWGINENIINELNQKKILSLIISQLKETENFINKYSELTDKHNIYNCLLKLNDGKTFEYNSHFQKLGKNFILRVDSYRDITERSRVVEVEPQEREKRYRDMVTETLYAILFIDVNTKQILEANDIYCNLLGYTKTEILKLTLNDIVPLNDENIEWNNRQLFTEKHLFIPETKQRRKDGSLVAVEASLNLIPYGSKEAVCAVIHDIKKRQVDEQAFRESEGRFQGLSEATFEGIVIHEMGKIIDVNQALIRLSGYEYSELIGTDAFNLLTLESREIAKINVINDYEKPYELVGLRKDRSTFPIEIQGKIILYQGRKVRVVAVRDITERKQALAAIQESEGRFRQLAENINGVFWLSDSNKPEMIYISPAYEEIWGRSRESLYKQDRSFLDAIDPEDLPQVISHFEQQRQGESTKQEYRIIRPDGSVRWIWDRAFPIKDESGQVYRISGIAEDITDRKQMEEKLARSLSLLKAALESTADGILVIDTAGKVKNYNQKFLEMWQLPESMLDWEHQEVLLTVATQLKESKDFLHQSKLYQNNSETETYHVLELTDGRVFERYSQPQRLEAEIVGRVFSFRDITKAKQAEEALKASEEKYRRIIETTSEGIWIINPNNKIVFANKRMAQMLGYTLDEIIGESLFVFTDADAGNPILEIAHLNNCYLCSSKSIDCKLQRKDGEIIWAIMSANPTFSASGEYTGCLGMLTDITERKRAEEALRQSEEQLRLSLEAGQMGIWDWNILTGQVKWWENIEPLYGFVPATFGGTFQDFLNTIHPEDLPYVTEAIASVIEQETDYEVEHRTIWPDGSIHWNASKGKVFRNEAGKAVRMLGIAMDITERKQAEQALREQKEFLRLILDNIPQYIFWKDRNSVYQGCNRNFAIAAGINNIEEVIGKTDYDFAWKKEESDFFRECDARVMNNDTPEYHIIESQHKADGKQVWLDTGKIPLHDAKGNVVGVLGSYEDITYRLDAEEALRKSEATNRALLNAIPDLMIRMTKDGTYLDFIPAKNFKNLSLLGDMQGKNIYEIMPLEIAEQRMYYVEQALATGLPQVYEFQIGWDDSNISYEEVRIVVSGKDEVLVMVRDISDRKQMEQALRQSEQRLRKQTNILAELAKSEILHSGSLNAALKEITEASARTLDVERTSVWLYNEDCSKMYCLNLYEQSKGHSFVAFELTSKNYPNYFQALNQERAIAAADANNDPRTKEFSESYLSVLSITSMLDAPIWLHGKMVGIVCHEHTGPIREWMLEEENFAGAIADLVSLAIQAQERKQVEEALRRAEAKYRGIFENVVEGIFQTTIDGHYVTANPMLARIYGYDSAAALMEDLTDIEHQLYVNSDRRKEFMRLVQEQQAIWGFESQVYRRDGSIIWISENAYGIYDSSGNLIGYEGTVEDITERKRAEDIIEYQAFHDLLTGLPNRTFFNDQLIAALSAASQNQTFLAVMFLDMDRFKTINDTLGHAIGDKLLQGFADRVKNCVREEDTIARWGGDEFTLLLPQINEPEDAATVAQRILDALKPPFNLEGHELYISSSIGIALYPQDGEDMPNLLKNADAALYRAKAQGRNNYRFYFPAMNSQASALLTLENQLHNALERDEFILYYQPQLNVKTNKITGMEVLLRWQHPELGLVSPKQFIPIAEENGLIVPIGEWVLRNACRQNKAWQDAGFSPWRVAVNLSARQFQQPKLVYIIERILSETGLEPTFLELEITESTIVQNVDFARSMLGDLQARGVHISMDDFGTGYSSLSYLKKFPFHTLKIDQSFVRDLTAAPEDTAIITAIITLGYGLNLRVVAEGVETTEQQQLLQSLGCEEMQGYLFSRPLPLAETTKLLNSLRERELLTGNGQQ